jgi:quercetin dioxygenase-like cupin family protein
MFKARQTKWTLNEAVHTRLRITKGSADYFTGSVRIDPLFQANDPARAVGVSVTFEPGSRNNFLCCSLAS